MMKDAHNSLQPSARLYGLWVIVGCATLACDELIQPALTSAGRLQPVRMVAEHWQHLGAGAGIGAFVIAIAVLARRMLKLAIVTLATTGVLAQTSKYCLGRVRPHWTGDVTVFHGPFGYFNTGPAVPIDSFPSGHTAVAFAMCQVLSLWYPQGKRVWILLATGVALARTLVDVHFPSDVIFGALLGTLVGRWACGTDHEFRACMDWMHHWSAKSSIAINTPCRHPEIPPTIDQPTKQASLSEVCRENSVALTALIVLITMTVWLFLRQ